MKKVRFWLDQSKLYVQDIETEQIQSIKNQKKIVLFLNAHNLTSDQMLDLDTKEGLDVLELFKASTLPILRV